MFNDPQQKQRAFKYLRYMRDGSTKEVTAVVRQKAKPKKEPKK